MAGSATTELQVLVKTPGVEKLPQLSSSLRRLTVSTKEAGLSFSKLSAGLKKQQAEGGKSINNTRSLSNAWKELAASVEFGSKQFEVATARAKRLDASLMKMQGTSKRAGGLGRMARTAGAVAGAGVFGGPEGALGAAIGGLMPGGGPISAAVGGAVGAQVGMVRQNISAIAEYDAALERQRKALRLVIKDTERFTQSQEFLLETSRELAIPQDVIVRQFTALTASVKGAGHSVEDAEKVFESIASGIRGTGGSLEDMKAAMTATAQVFSKGKVSAEELRQQLGERLPGAFTIFAESMGLTPAELDKALEGGKVTLQDFMTFSEVLFERYGENAKKLASGPEAAGDRLATAMSELKDELGNILGPMGAGFQTFAEDAVKEITKIITAFNKLFGIGIDNQIEKLKKELNFWQSILDMQEKANTNLKKLPGGDIWGLEGTSGFEGTKGFVEALERRIKALEKQKDEIEKGTDAIEEQGKTGKGVYEGLTAGVEKYLNGIKSLGEEIGDAVGNAFKGMEDAIVSFVTTGKASFKDFARSILADMARIYARQLMLKIFSSIATASMGTLTEWNTDMPIDAAPIPFKNAKGNAFAKNGIVPFAQGGVVSQPTIFPYAKGGIGLMGEAGPEAIMPLKRGSDGRLGVEAKYRGGGGTTVNYTGPTLNFNGDEYVPRSAVGEIIATATSQGAKAGESRTLRTLQNSRSSRARIGL